MKLKYCSREWLLFIPIIIEQKYTLYVTHSFKLFEYYLNLLEWGRYLSFVTLKVI